MKCPRLLGRFILGALTGTCSYPLVGSGQAQTGMFQPGANPISNQAWTIVAVTPGTTNIPVTRALFNGNATACNIAVTPNGSTTVVTFQNVQPGEILPIQVINVGGASTCSNILALY